MLSPTETTLASPTMSRNGSRSLKSSPAGSTVRSGYMLSRSQSTTVLSVPGVVVVMDAAPSGRSLHRWCRGAAKPVEVGDNIRDAAHVRPAHSPAEFLL